MNSIKIRLQVLAVAIVVAASVAVPSEVHAADFGDGWVDAGSYDNWIDGGSFDPWSDAGSYDNWSDAGSFDPWSDAGSYDDYYDPGTGGDWYDPGTGGDWYDPGTGDDWYDPGTGDEYYDPGYADYYDPGYSNYGSGGSYGGGSYGGGYSTGGGYSVKPTGGYPVTIYQPTYQTPKPTPSTPSNTTVVNNNTNTNTNVNNNTAIAVAQVQISGQTTSQPTYPQYPTYPAPYCTISHTQYTAYNYGTKQIYLSWTSSNASSAYLSGYGSVAVNGSQTVYAAASQTYTLTVYGYNGQQATCQTTVYGTTYTPTPYVSLTQIPYTGFDFGPFGNAMYWAGLVTVALAGAYLAVYYVPSMAFAGTARRAYAPVVAPKAPILAEKEAALGNLAPIVASVRKAGTSDAMAIVKSTDGSMPKIVIERY